MDLDNYTKEGLSVKIDFLEDHIIKLEKEIINLKCCGNCKYYVFIESNCHISANEYDRENNICNKWEQRT